MGETLYKGFCPKHKGNLEISMFQCFCEDILHNMDQYSSFNIHIDTYVVFKILGHPVI